MQTRDTVEGLYISFLLNTFNKIEIKYTKKKKKKD